MAYNINESGMTCFQLIKAVLDKIYDKLPSNKDAMIEDSLECLWEGYRKLTNGAIPEYNDYYKCFAYLYCFVAAHANIVYELINLSPELSEAFDTDELRVSCLGGGPGSDLLGILKFMQRKNKLATLYCDIYDKQVIWEDFWQCICKESHCSFPAHSSFRLFDITVPTGWSNYTELWNSDFFMMSFFMSEVYPIHNMANGFFERVFEQAKLGSFFLFVDNTSDGAEGWFDSLLEKHNRTRKHGRIEVISTSDLYQEQLYSFQMEYRECKEDLEPYFGRYKNQHGRVSQPKLTADIVYRICRKQLE